MDTGGRDHYPDYGSPSSGPSSTPSSGGGASGAGSGDPCSLPIEANLEEVALCDYWVQHADVPAIGTEVDLLETLVSGRLGVICEGLLVGYLPVRFNFVHRQCLPAGVTYSGEVTDSDGGAIPAVTVILYPQ